MSTSSTKIINVLKDDSFQEIIDLFKATPAAEVIFVLPKRSRAFQKEDHFVTLKSEAKELGKAVSFLCSSPELNEMAKKHHFDVLLARAPIPRKAAKPKNAINVVNQIEDFYSEPAHDADSISIAKPESEEEVEDMEEFEEVATAVPVSMGTRRLEDVLTPETEDQQTVKVSGAAEKAMPVKVSQPEFMPDESDHPALDDIERVWAQPTTENLPMTKTAAASWPAWLGRSQKLKDKPAKNILPGRPAHRTGLIVLACAAVVVLGTVVFISTGKAQVTIKPVDKPLDLKLAVFASDNIPAIDPLHMAIPGQVFNIQKTVTQEFPATGHVDVAQKARGTLTVYNEQTSTQQLIATTRFESADHHIFHTLASITVPAAKTDTSGKLIPGSIEAQVIADKAGPEFNVPVGIFTVPAFKERGDSAKAQKVYGQSTSPMHSGTSGQSTVVTEENLSDAKQALSEALTASVQEELKAQINDLKIINDSQVAMGTPLTSAPATATSTTFKASLAGTLKTVGFKQSDLDALIAQYVDTHNNATVVPSKLTLTYDNIRWDDTKGGLIFDLHVTGPAFAKIDQARISGDLLGKSGDQIKAYLGGIAGISEAQVSLSPFWVRSVPKNEDRVHIDLSY